MAKNVLLILLSAAVCAVLPSFAQDESTRKPDQLVRALALKGSDVVALLEPEPFLAPRIADRARSVKLDGAPEHSIDVVVLYDVLHGVDHRPEFYAKLHRALRFGGRVVNVDLSAQLPEPQAVREFTAAGFHITKTVAFLPSQYFQVFE
jgi:Methyltransferase domain